MQHGLNLNTVVCENCGFVFTNPLPPQHVYEQFYQEAYTGYYGKISVKLESNGSGNQTPPQFIKHLLDQIESIYPLGGRSLLEIGSGQGMFLWWAQRRCARVLGVEPAPEFQQVLREAGLPIIEGSLETLQISKIGKFDCIVMSHVLEHLYDLDKALETCRDLLSPDGILALEVPNILKPFRSLDMYFLRYVHLVNFSPETLPAMLEKHNFQVALLDQGGDDWKTPQSLFVLARPHPNQSGKFNLPKQTASQVVSHLEGYRKKWRWPLRYFWFFRMAYLSWRHWIFTTLSRGKKWLLSSR